MGRYWVTSGHKHLANDEWLTPPWMIESLGPFDLDPCAAIKRPWETAQKYFTIEMDGLNQKWFGRVWVNPPYGRGLDQWIIKASNHGNGLAIFPLRSTDTVWFHEAVWKRSSGILFVRGRVRFWTPDGIEGGPCPHSSIIVAWGQGNADVLEKAKIKGHFIRGIS